MIRRVPAIVLAGHGAIRVPGFVTTWELAEVEELGGPSLILGGLQPGHPALRELGLLWLLAMLGFLLAAVGVATGQAWWPTLAGVSAAISLVVTVLWWKDARVGAVVSGIVLMRCRSSMTAWL